MECNQPPSTPASVPQDQDIQRQLDECREHTASKFPNVEDVDVYADIISGTDEHGGEQYRDLCDDIDALLEFFRLQQH